MFRCRVKIQVLRRDHAVFRDHAGTLQHIAQFANVSRPGISSSSAMA